MNPNRKAQLQRKLTMRAIPDPPPALRKDLHAGIPADLGRPRRGWLSSPYGFMARVAASIVLLITAVVVTMLHLEPGEEPALPSAPRGSVQRPAIDRAADPGTIAPVAARDKEEVDVLTPSEEAVLTKARAARPPAVAQSEDAAERAQAEASESQLSEPRLEPLAETSLVTAQKATQREVAAELRPAPSGAPRDPSADSAPAFAAPPPPPPAPAAPPPPADLGRAVVGGVSGGVVSPTRAAPTASVIQQGDAAADTAAAHGRPTGVAPVFAAIRSGVLPARESVDVDAVVNHFARNLSAGSGRSPRLDVELSPTPIASDRRSAVLRVTVDRGLDSENGETVAVSITIDVDRRVAETDSGAGSKVEAMLSRNASVTTLRQLQLRPRLDATQPIATVEVRYAEGDDATETILRRSIHVRDLAPAWEKASVRHRLATLSAAWAETIAGRAAKARAVADLASELAEQNRDHPLARELAELTAATENLRAPRRR